MKEHLFREASRRKLRFASTKGHLTVEDLWDLNLKSLDALAIGVAASLQPQHKSFLENPDPRANAEEETNNLKLEILKAIITIKQDENKVAFAEASRRKQREFLNNLLEKKKIGVMEEMSIEQIEEQLRALS